MQYEINFFHYLRIYKKEWRRIIVLIAIVVFITAIGGWLQPTVYRSTVTILSPKEGGQGGAGGYLGFLNISISGSSDDVIFSMLKSARMRRDINEHFNRKDNPKFWWGLDTYVVTGGFSVEVKGSDPEMTEKIANFSVEHLDKINEELQVTTQKPMAKVLDPAVKGSPMGKNVSKKIIASGLFIFMTYSLYIFFKEYLSQLKKSQK